MKANARIKGEQESGKLLREKIDISKQTSASLLTKNSTHQIGKDIMDIVKLGCKKRWDNEKDKVEKGSSTHAKRIANVNAVITKKG